MVTELIKTSSIADKFILELRSISHQNDRMRFRTNLQRLGEIFGYEISKTLNFVGQEVTTPLGSTVCKKPKDNIVIASILRAGIPIHDGMLRMFDDAENAFISAYRSHHKDGTFDISLEYVTSPSLDKKTVILVDPMLATGSSMEKAIEALQEYGKWKSLHIVAVIASSQGIKHIRRLFKSAHIWVGAIDDELTAKSYIVPGLGDAGDLAFGSKG